MSETECGSVSGKLDENNWQNGLDLPPALDDDWLSFEH